MQLYSLRISTVPGMIQAACPALPCSANTGVDVSRGRVTKTFEVIPSMANPIVATKLTQAKG